MYYSYFGLKEAPFSIAPNPDYLFMTERHQVSLAHLYHGVESDAGFVLLTGDIGTGKTTVCRQFLKKLPHNTQIAFILNPRLDSVELLEAICQEFEIPDVPTTPSLRQLSDMIYQYLLDNHAKGINTILLIDEAQQMHQQVLEQIRLLTNLETDTQKLLKIVLVGQPELNDTLNSPSLKQLSQRITARYHINPLNLGEVAKYVKHRLQMAGYDHEQKDELFSPRLIALLFSMTQGVPRLLNIVCDRALLGTYSQNQQVVSQAILYRAYDEVRGNYREPNTANTVKRFTVKKLAVAFSGVTMLLALVVAWQLYVSSLPKPTTHYSYTKPNRSVPPVSVKTPTDKSRDLAVENSQELLGDQQDISKKAIDTTVNHEPLIVEDIAEHSDNINAATLPPVGTKEQVIAADVPVVDHAITPVPDKPEAKRYANKTKAINDLMHNVADADSCDALSWRCTDAQVFSWNAFKKYNRPAILALLDDNDQAYYVVVVGIDSTQAKVISQEGIGFIPLIELGENWLGEFTYVWQPPLGFKRFIYKNSGEDLIYWLSSSFATIDERDELLANRRYNERLKKRIELFQQQHNLKVDGKAGTETLLKLNEALGVAVTLEPDAINDISLSESGVY